MTTTVDDCLPRELPKISRPEGSITTVEARFDVPFDIERVYYLYDIPGGEQRGAHAHRTLEQFFVCVMGCFTVTVDDGDGTRSFVLDRAYNALHVPRLIWRSLTDFSSGAVCLVLASAPYDAADYLRDYDEFKRLKSQLAKSVGDTSR